MKTFLLKPKPGVLVKDPMTGLPLPEGGDVKPKTTYWNRRVVDGDAIITTAPVRKKKAPAKITTTEPVTEHETERT